MALAATACAVVFMIANQPPPAAKVVKREAPSRTLAYEQAIATPAPASEETAADKAPPPPEEKPEAKASADQPKETKTPKVPAEAPAQEQAAIEPPEEPAPETEEMPWLRNDAGAPPRVAGVPPQGHDPYAPQQNVPQSHDGWAPPDEEGSYGQGADQWGNQGEDQWGNESYDQGYDQGYNNYGQPNDQWNNEPFQQGHDPNAPRDQWGNPQPQDQWGNAQPQQDQWGNAQPQDQWGNQPGQPGQPGQYGQNPNQWADQNTQSGEQWVQVVQSGAEMRAAAADDAPSLFAFPSGRNLRVITYQDGWAQVTDPQSSATGWMKLQYLAPAGAQRPGYEPQYDAYYQEPPRERRGLFRGGFADMINRAFGGGN